jgi:hypothetical protein
MKEYPLLDQKSLDRYLRQAHELRARFLAELLRGAWRALAGLARRIAAWRPGHLPATQR